ncbi:hypothetical protein CC80DRAFT_566401 [Byssothecium circinans]|uniref:Fumarylacetoacetase-like C-terminal domain-containing protein n=1 Tax=Byssothecium circinans TaxID=147558 RepID=A0A6A5TTT6_9PLEO|nr:hypothetical protein CC80DRAFT_566401 [Byssothecium circinans]
MGSFKHLIRFQNASSQIFYGELDSIKDGDEKYVGRTVRVIEGTSPWDPGFRITDRTETIAEVSKHAIVVVVKCADHLSKVLCPLPSVLIFVCVGLNYRQHANETGMAITPYPVIFTKPADALAGPFEDVPIHKECKHMDYEVELCFIIGKDCKNVSEGEDAMQYILGYTAGNDVSSRYWQQPERSGNQHGSAKSFDKFALIGPAITHVSGGTTLRKGTVVMTGTPSGVAAAMKPPVWLEDGDVVEVEIENIGRLSNKMVFEK